MLCDSIKEEDLDNFNLSNYQANIKYDGERIAIIKQDEDIFLLNRSGREKSRIYPEIQEAFKSIKGNFILDGEVVAKDEQFNTLQHRSNLSNPQKIIRARQEIPIKFVAFDILFFAMEDLRGKPLKERLKYLESFKFDFSKNDYLEIAEYNDIEICLDYAKHYNCEGIVIKNMSGTYEGKRSKNWLKLKLFKEAQIRVESYTENPKGIRCEDMYGNAVQISGQQHEEIQDEIDSVGFCDITIQYLEKTKNDRYRFISYKGKAK